MSPPPAPPPLNLAEMQDLAAVISAKVDQDFGSVRAFLNAVLFECSMRGIDVGYRRASRIYLRWQREDAHETDVKHGVVAGYYGQDRSYRQDPTGEEAVKNVMNDLLGGVR